MGKKEISGSAELEKQILQMNTQRSIREAELNQSFKELKKTFFIPTSIKKENSKEEPQDDKRDLLNLSKMMINKSTDYVLEQNFGQKRSFVDFFTSMIVEILLSPFINKKITVFFS